MLPPPTTIANSTPRSHTRCTSAAIAAMGSASAPYSALPIRASPESFRRMRLKAGRAPSAEGCALTSKLSLRLAALEASEAPDHDVLTRLRRGGSAQVLDALAAVLVLVHVLLLEQDDLLEPLAQLALGDLRADVLGLVGGLLLVDAQLGLPGLLRHVLLGHVERRGGRDVQRNVLGELLEVLVARHEVCLAVDLDEHADLARGVHVALDQALRRRALAALRGLRLALNAQDLDGLVHLAARFLERLLAVHHPGTRTVAQGLHVAGRDSRGHQPTSCSGRDAASRCSAAFTSASSPPRGRGGCSGGWWAPSGAGAGAWASAAAAASRAACS